MLADGKLNSLDTRLEQFKLNNASSLNELQGVLRDYAQLIEDYKALKRSAEDKPKPNGVSICGGDQVAEKPRNPYLLVLVDGNGYIFNDELVRDKEEGGMRAARMLNHAVEKYLRESLPQVKDVRVIVRIYADLTTVSKQLAKSKIIGMEKRSLAPFAAAFTRAINLFDFVDALDEEGTKMKLRESFKLAVEDSSCSHVLYAACHDPSYIAQLMSHADAREKITLVQGAGFVSDYHQLGLNITQFPTVFRWSELSSAPPTKAPVAMSADRNETPPKGNNAKKSYYTIQNASTWRTDGETSFGAEEPSSAGTNGFPKPTGDGWTQNTYNKKSSKTPCKYFQKGYCHFGNKCIFQHASAEPTPPVDRSNISSQLPTMTTKGLIPLNAAKQRLDCYMAPPTQEAWVIYNARFNRKKPCNDHHLQASCTRFQCPYDHTELEPQARYCLEYVVKCSPCPRKGKCRSADCFYGHICQRDDCLGQMKGCRMKMEQHRANPAMATVVAAEEDMLEHDDLTADMHAQEAGDYVASW